MLKPEYQEWYPTVMPGKWYRVKWLMELIQRQQDRLGPHWELPPRVLDDAHFSFRGGRRFLRGRQQQRLTDLILGA